MIRWELIPSDNLCSSVLNNIKHDQHELIISSAAYMSILNRIMLNIQNFYKKVYAMTKKWEKLTFSWEDLRF